MKGERRYRPRWGALGAAVLTLAATQAGCIRYLDSGEVGQMRYFGDVRGDVPLRFTAPISDRNGNIYALFGSIDIAEVIGFVGHAGGGWSGHCTVTENSERGVHGYVGRSQDRAWYWSGDSLVEVSGTTGGCRELLDQDPTTGANLGFKGVIPWVKETPSRTTTVAMIQSPSDRVPFFVRVDLDQGVYTHLSEFVPRGADGTKVLGVGAHPPDDTGVFVVSYMLGDSVRVEGRFVDDTGAVTDIANISGLKDVDEDGIAGFMQISDSGFAAGVLLTGELVVFNSGGGGIRNPGNLMPVGVQRWDGEVWIVGIGNGRPAVARLAENGTIEAPQVWASSERTASALVGSHIVLDDRVKPVTTLDWTSPTTAVGKFPFVQAHPLPPYAQDTTLLLVAGPGYTTAGQPFTSVAVAPVGVTFP